MPSERKNPTVAKKMSRPTWSLRLKFMLVVVALLSSSMLVYLGLAVRLFEDDKTTYVHDGSATLANAVAGETTSLLHSVLKTLGSIANAKDKIAFAREAFASDPDIVELSLYEGQDHQRLLRLTKAEYLEEQGLDVNYFDELQTLRPPPFTAMSPGKEIIESAEIEGGAPLLTVALATYQDSMVARVRQDRLLKLLLRSELYQTYLVTASGHPIIKKNVADAASPRFIDLMSRINKQQGRTGSIETDTSIAAYARTGAFDLVVIAEITRDEAFRAARRLMLRSLGMALIIVVCSILVSAIFTKKITKSIEKLYLATKRVANGDFKFKVEEGATDEVGALAKAFNRMTAEIIKLMSEVADKARMEKELETARVVQENLFPSPALKCHGIDLASFYAPASECGGDWCGYFELDHRVLVLLGDATGHGVPAALITAAAQSCCTTLLRAEKQGYLAALDAAKVMDFLNASIHAAAHGKVKMTFFVSIIDTKNYSMSYCNASHEMPLLFGSNPRALPRLLGTSPDPCLGDDASSVFHAHEVRLNKGDLLVWYTDGLLECKNKNDEEWGERLFLSSVMHAWASPVEAMRDHIISEAMNFCRQGIRDDDVTLLIARLTDTKAS